MKLLRFIDRLFCVLVYGHTWKHVLTRDAKRCVHCELELGAFDVIRYWRRRARVFVEIGPDGFPIFRPSTPAELSDRAALHMGWPKRAWRVPPSP